MRNYIYLLLFSLIHILSGCAVSIYSSRDENVNFNNYKTFAWNPKVHTVKNPIFDNQIIESNVKNFGSAELKRRGMFSDVDSADLIFDYELVITDKTYQESQPIYGQQTRIVRPYNPYNGQNSYYNNPYNYNYPNYNYNNYNNSYITTPYVVGYKTINVPYEEGTLTIMAIDRRRNRLIWKGVAVGTVTDEQTYEYELHSDMRRIFKEYPLKVVKNKR
jgi:hypothetical protein